MNKLFKSISIVLVLALLLSACGMKRSEKATAEIEKYFANNDYNACQKYISELDDEILKEINSSALHLITNEFFELLVNNNLSIENTYTLNSINGEFTENCRKLWNVAKLFDIQADYNDYNNLAMLHYYGEMSNYIKYSEIFELLESVHKSGYLVKITECLLAYDSSNDSSGFEDAYTSANAFDFSDFDPQEYLVEDYKSYHGKALKALKSVCNGIATKNISVTAIGINDLEEALTEILFIVDTVYAVKFQLSTILNDISNTDIYKSFNHYIDVSSRDFSAYTGFALDKIFGDSVDDGIEIENENLVADSQELSLNQSLTIVVNAINKTKAYKNKVNISLKQTRNISLMAFSTDGNEDLAELSKTKLSQALESTNGTGVKDYSFNNGVCEGTSLNSFIPPSNNSAYAKSEAIKEYTAIKGSGGYVITLVLYPEASSKDVQADGIKSLINGFTLENSDSILDAKTSYSTANVKVTVRNNGLLEKMEYTIKGISDCDCGQNGEKQFDADFSFEESYIYEFKY